MFTRHRVFKVMAALLVLLGLVAVPGQPAPVAAAPANITSCYFLTAAHSFHNLDVEGASLQDGARIIQWYQDNRATNQKFKIWRYENMVQNAFYIESVQSGKVLEPATFAAGAQIIQHTFYGGDNQQWIMRISGADGAETYRNLRTGYYLDVAGASYAAGAPLVQWENTGAKNFNQVFLRIPTSCS